MQVAQWIYTHVLNFWQEWKHLFTLKPQSWVEGLIFTHYQKFEVDKTVEGQSFGKILRNIAESGAMLTGFESWPVLFLAVWPGINQPAAGLNFLYNEKNKSTYLKYSGED